MNKEIYVDNWIFGRVPFPHVCERISALGFDGLEMIGEPDQYEANQVKKTADACGLKISSICGIYPGGPEDLRALCHSDRKEREKGIGYVKSCVDFAAAIGAKTVIVVPSLVGQAMPYVTREADYEAAVDSIRRAGEYAGAVGIRLVIEPINRYEVYLVNGVREAVRMAEDVGLDGVKVMGDVFHMNIEESDGVPAALRAVGGKWLGHVHLSDNTREPPGLGALPWEEILDALREIGYEGPLVFEPLPKGKMPYDTIGSALPADLLDRQLGEGLRYIRGILRGMPDAAPAIN